MYLITKEDEILFNRCINHMSPLARGKIEEDYSSTVLSQDPTLNTYSSDDKNDESTQPSSEEASTKLKQKEHLQSQSQELLYEHFIYQVKKSFILLIHL